MDQMYLECESTIVKIMSFRPRNWVQTKKKVFTENWRVLSPKSNEDQKKGLSRNMGLNSAGIYGIYSCWLAFFVWSISDQIFMGAR